MNTCGNLAKIWECNTLSMVLGRFGFHWIYLTKFETAQLIVAQFIVVQLIVASGVRSLEQREQAFSLKIFLKIMNKQKEVAKWLKYMINISLATSKR